MKNDFYIGWMPSAPQSLSKYLNIIIVVLLFSIGLMAAILSLKQRSFSTANFEFGKLTAVTGIYQDYPVPSIKVLTKPDAFGNDGYLTIPLVGYGKFGAEGVIQKIQQENNVRLDRKEVCLRGTLLYSDGKTLLQIDAHDKPLVKWSNAQPKVEHDRKELGTVTLTGEVIDPKCYFGVMKPGHGKPHLDCAVRCIEGGMSPVFYVRDAGGIANYYLILDKEGKKMNAHLKNFIGRPICLRANAKKFDDWVVLYVDPVSIKPTGKLSWFKMNDEYVSCIPVK